MDAGSRFGQPRTEVKRLTVVAAGVVIGLACIVGWTWPRTAPRNSPHHELASINPQSTPQPVEGRIFLSSAQISEARSGGIVDRPIRSLLKVTAPMGFGDYVWNEKGVLGGPTWVRVDLRSQLISVFRGGDEIGTAVIVYGGDNKKTPPGELHILSKAREHRSSLYDASMPYTLRLTGDGVSIHGSAVRLGAATHGCIGVPLPFAERLFDAVKVGDHVEIAPSRRISA